MRFFSILQTTHNCGCHECMLGTLCVIYTASDDLNLVTDLWKTDVSTVDIKPDTVMLSVGSNDLAQLNTIELAMIESLCTPIKHFVTELIIWYRVKSVIINPTVPCIKRISYIPVVFQTIMECFNSILSHWCDKNDNLTSQRILYSLWKEQYPVSPTIQSLVHWWDQS